MDSSSSGMIILWIILALVFLIPGGLLLRLYIHHSRKQRGVLHWPSTTGIIKKTSIEQKSRRTLRRGFLFGAGQEIVYYPKIEYSYTINAQEFIGNRYRIAYDGIWAHPDIEKSEKILIEYPEGKEVQIYFDPKDPGQSWLIPSPLKANLAMLIISATAFLLIGVLILAYTLQLFTQSINWFSSRQANSSAVLPVNATTLKTQIEEELGFICSPIESKGGNEKYKGWRCVQATNDEVPEIVIYSRGKGSELVDLVRISTTQSQKADFRSISTSLIHFIFPDNDSEMLSWFSQVMANGSTSDKMQGIPIGYSGEGTYLNLWFGQVK